MLHWKNTLFAAFSAMLILAGYLWHGSRTVAASAAEASQDAFSTWFVSPSDLTDSLTTRIRVAGWPDQASEAAENLNLERFVWLQKESPTLLEREIRAYTDLLSKESTEGVEAKARYAHTTSRHFEYSLLIRHVAKIRNLNGSC